jgi:hypothetical protein
MSLYSFGTFDEQYRLEGSVRMLIVCGREVVLFTEISSRICMHDDAEKTKSSLLAVRRNSAPGSMDMTLSHFRDDELSHSNKYHQKANETMLGGTYLPGKVAHRSCQGPSSKETKACGSRERDESPCSSGQARASPQARGVRRSQQQP